MAKVTTVNYKLRYFAASDTELKSPVTIDKLTRKECAAIRESLLSRGALNVQRFKNGKAF